ncbi:MAG: nuclear transport factor 2 family protein [Terriglobia bacterium]
MKQSMLFMISIMLPAMLAQAVPHSKPADMPSVESEVKSLEARRFQALVEADVPALENLLSDDLVYTHASGLRQNKAEFLASIRSGEIQYHSFTPQDVKVRLYGSTAVVTGHASVMARTKGQEVSSELLYLEAFVKQDGRWQLVAWQSLRMGP